MSQKNKKNRTSRRLYKKHYLAVLIIVIALIVAGGLYVRAAGMPQWLAAVPGAQSVAKLIGVSSFDLGEYADIQEDDDTIMTNEDALHAYVVKFGPNRSTKRLYELSAKYGNCHNVAHKAGRFSYEIYKEKAFKECSAECHSGCYHGATEAYFKENGTANLTENLNVICSSELNSFFSHQCLHGIGHGLMAWTSYELFDALESCDILERGHDSCYTGVFMENIVGGLESEASKTEQEVLAGHFTKYLSSDPQYPCNDPDLADKYKPSCYFLQTSRVLQMFPGDFQKVAEACSDAPESYRRQCFQSMGRDAGGNFHGNPAGAIDACSKAPKGTPRIDCIMGASQDTFWDPSGQGAAVNFCALVDDKAEKDACYRTIISRAPEVLLDEASLAAFCTIVEDPYRAQCRTMVEQETR